MAIIFSLFVLVFILNLASSQEYEVALIVGGIGGTYPDHEYFSDAEIYTGHLPSDYTSCAENVTIPPLPYPIRDASSVFLENHGIFVCGGRNDRDEPIPYCYKYNPYEAEQWEAVVIDNNLAIYFAAIAPGVPGDQQLDSGFWILGGVYTSNGVRETYMYKTDEPHNITEGHSLLQPTYGHCAVTLNYNGLQNVLAIAGSQDGYHMDEVYIYCNDTTGPHCKEGSEDGWTWKETSSLNHVRVWHSCTIFNHHTKGQAVLVAGGLGRESSEILYIEDCPNNPSSCGWQLAGDLLQGVRASGMVTLNNDPVMFGGLDYGTLNSLSLVQKYSWESDSYTLLQNMSKPRSSHSIVSVPEHFLCQFSPTSSTAEP